MTPFWAWSDKNVSNWNNVWFNVRLGVLFFGIALLMPGWARDVWMLSAGANFGYAFMWFIYPRFTKATPARDGGRDGSYLLGCPFSNDEGDLRSHDQSRGGRREQENTAMNWLLLRRFLCWRDGHFWFSMRIDGLDREMCGTCGNIREFK